MLTVKQNGGLLIVRDEEGRMVRKLNAVARRRRTGSSWEPPSFTNSTVFRFQPRGSTLAEATKQMGQ